MEAWVRKGKHIVHIDDSGRRFFYLDELVGVPEIDAMLNTNWEQEAIVSPSAVYNSVELFAGAGGLALGMEKAGFNHVLLNEFDKFACQTLRANRPNWNVVEGDIHNIDFSPYEGKVHFLSGNSWYIIL